MSARRSLRMPWRSTGPYGAGRPRRSWRSCWQQGTARIARAPQAIAPGDGLVRRRIAGVQGEDDVRRRLRDEVGDAGGDEADAAVAELGGEVVALGHQGGVDVDPDQGGGGAPQVVQVVVRAKER